ncbi:type II toxin-antitoxin system RelE/ParE family toxin [Mesoterricola silvestris]|uniref:type II toxin-antitoxin system RelE/ParE family toxin n=1 Tax=Mesoterricola silvestris TaxID=2927979 RepID=UPI002930CCBB|nr:type II toxin-antitoxin system RelE/ParE family toxin [Mesoterricola silvestris]
MRVTRGAEGDLAEIVAFLAEREGPTVAERILEGILDAANDLAEFPERGSCPKELLNLGIREFRQVMFQPYRLIYRIAGNQALLLLVADGRREFQSQLERRVLRD